MKVHNESFGFSLPLFIIVILIVTVLTGVLYKPTTPTVLGTSFDGHGYSSYIQQLMEPLDD